MLFRALLIVLLVVCIATVGAFALTGLAINDRISRCLDGTHPDYIQDDAERFAACGYE